MENQPQHNQISLEVTKLPNSTISLINTLPLVNGFALTEKESTAIAMQIIKLDFETVLYTEKIFQAVKTPKGKQNTFKIICGLLTFFSQATKVKQQLSSSEIIMCTDWIMKTYTHDSVEDVALALKGAIFGGHKFYGTVTIADVRDIISCYIDDKYQKVHEINKARQNDSKFDTLSNEVSLILLKSNENQENPVSFKEKFLEDKRQIAGKISVQIREKLQQIQEQKDLIMSQNAITI